MRLDLLAHIKDTADAWLVWRVFQLLALTSERAVSGHCREIGLRPASAPRAPCAVSAVCRIIAGPLTLPPPLISDSIREGKAVAERLGIQVTHSEETANITRRMYKYVGCYV